MYAHLTVLSFHHSVRFEPILVPAGTKKGIFIVVNETTLEDNLIGMNRKSGTSCSVDTTEPFNFATWFENDDLSVSEGVYKDTWTTTTGSALESFGFLGTVYYTSLRPTPSPALALPATPVPSLSLSPSMSIQPSLPLQEAASPSSLSIAAVDGIMFEVYAKNRNLLIHNLALTIFSVSPEYANGSVSLKVYSTQGSFYDESMGDRMNQSAWTERWSTQIYASPTLESVRLSGTFNSIFVKQGTTIGLFVSIQDSLRNHKILAKVGTSVLADDFDNDDISVKEGIAVQWQSCDGWGVSLTDTNNSPIPHAYLGSLLYTQAGTSIPTSVPSHQPSLSPSTSFAPSNSAFPSGVPSLSKFPLLPPSSLPSMSKLPSLSPTDTAKPTYENMELRTRYDVTGNSGDGLMFDIVANEPVAVNSFILHLNEYPMNIKVYSRRGSHYHAYDDASKWEEIESYTNYTATNSGRRLSFPAQYIGTNQTRAFYVAIVETYGEVWPLHGGLLPGNNYKLGE